MTIDDKFVSDFKENVMGRGMYHFYEKVQQFMPMIADIVNRYQCKLEGAPLTLIFNTKDMIKLTLAFYQDFNPNLFDKLVCNFKQGANVFVLSNDDIKRGVQYPATSCSNGKLTVVLECVCRDINSLCTTPHEFAHVCSQRNVEKKNAKRAFAW